MYNQRLSKIYINRPVLQILREDKYFRRDFTFQQTFSTKLDRVKTFSTSFHPEHREG